VADQDLPTRYRDVFAVRQFQALWLAHLQSRVGDQLARVALSVLVYDRTGSPAWTALTYAMTILPNLAGGALLAGYADRFSRRGVMVTADVLRAVLVAAMAVPGAPTPVTVGLLILVQLPFAPFSAARSAILPAILSGDRFVVGVAVLRTTDQFGLLAGIGAGAALVAAIGTHTTLVVDAATFAVSAVLLAVGVRAHEPRSGPDHSARSWWESLRHGFGLVVTDRRLRALVFLACVNGLYVVPEGVAVPYAALSHGGTAAVGWLLAAIPAGSIVGMLVLKAVRPGPRLRLLAPLAVATCAVLVPTAWAPPLVLSVLLWAASGAFSAHDMVVQATFVRLVPDAMRGQAVGLAGAAMQTAQGVGIVAAGLLAEALSPGLVVGVAGGVGVFAAAGAALAWVRAASPRSLVGRGETGGLGAAVRE
jgi:predicted MFS family arabinose efflux permease